MTKSIKIALIIITVMVECFQPQNSRKVDDRIISVVKKFNLSEASVIARSVIERPFRFHSDYLRRRLDSLKQWKRRRRASIDYENSATTSDNINFINKDLNKNKNCDNKVSTPSSEINSDRVQSVDALVENFKKKWPLALWRRYGLFTDDYITLINVHWLLFPPPDPAINYGLGGIYVLFTTVGGFGNGIVILLYLRCSSLRTPGNILVANLALSDFFMVAKTPVFIFNSFNLGPALGKTGCVTYGFLGGLTGVTSIATLAAIALDRYWAVVRPLEPLRALTAVRAKLFAVGAWIYAAIFATIPALDIGYGRYVPEGYLTSCSFDYLTDELAPRYFIFVFFCAGWLAPFITISFCYLNIFRVVVGTRSVGSKSANLRLSARHVKEKTKRKAEVKLAMLVIVVIALFFISWTPYAVVTLIGIFGKKGLITPLVSMVPALFCKTAACVNPFVYIITHPKFKKEFKRMLLRRRSRRSDGTFKTRADSTDVSKMHRPSRDFSDTEVEIIEMKNIPYHNESEGQVADKQNMITISSKVSGREGSLRSVSMKSFEESVVSPPSWYVQPTFEKKKSFQRRSTRSIISQNTDPTA